MAGIGGAPAGGFGQDVVNSVFPEDQIPPGSRNILYRKRRVRIEYFWSGSGEKSGFLGLRSQTGDGKNPDVIELAEVESVTIQTQAGTATALGPVRAVIQPWYFQPLKIDIQGKSYVGAFSTRRLNIGVDTDIEKILKFRQNINQDFQAGDINKLKVLISYFDTGDSSNLAVSQEYEGFIDDISISENQSSPYIRGYTVKFTGEPKDTKDILSGGNGQRDDRGLIARTVAGIQASLAKIPVLDRVK
jgi:hypothetical protein